MRNLSLWAVLAVLSVAAPAQAIWPFGESEEEKAADLATRVADSLREPNKTIAAAQDAAEAGETEEAIRLFRQAQTQLEAIEAREDTAGPAWSALRLKKFHCISSLDALALKRAEVMDVRQAVTDTSDLEARLAAERAAIAKEKAAEAAAALARLLPACPLCLDAQHLLFTALTACGRPADAALVQREARALAARLPGLTALKFADGQPFADAGTRQWLHAEDSAPAADRGPAADDETENLRAKARETAAGGNLAAALDTLEDARRRLGERSARAFPLRMEQARLLAQAGHAQAAVPLAEELERFLLK